MSRDLTFPSDFGADWHDLVRELEQRVASAEAALAEMRAVVARLAAFEPNPAQAEPQPDAPAVWKFDGYDAPEAPAEAPEEAFAAGEDEPDAVREEVSRTVAEVRAELEAGLPDADATSEASWPVLRPFSLTEREVKTDGLREEQEAAGELPDGRDGAAADAWAPSQDDAARRDEVARIVAQMRGELGSSFADAGEEPEEGEPGPEADEDARREEVRRAVEAARAELAKGMLHHDPEPETSGDGEAPDNGSDLSRFAFSDWPSAQMETSGPPVIVIKDQDGRVELARVYETLRRIDCGENAALLNYTPHSVTIGLSARVNVPSREEMSEAVEQVFGRRCRVQSDGVRLSVDIGRE